MPVRFPIELGRDPMHAALDAMIPALEPASPTPIPMEAPMFGSVGRDPDLHDGGRSVASAVLPYAVTLVFGLLAGFAGGYFVRSRDRTVSEPAAVRRRLRPDGTANMR